MPAAVNRSSARKLKWSKRSAPTRLRRLASGSWNCPKESRSADALLLVEGEGARLAAVVGEVLAVVALEFALGAEVHPRRAGCRLPRLGERQADPAAYPVQIDHRGRDRVVQPAADAVRGKGSLHPAQRPAPADSALTLADVLAGSPPDVESPCLVAAVVEELRRKRSAVQRVQVEIAQLQCEGAVGRGEGGAGAEDRAGGLAVGILAGVRRVVAEAVETVPGDTGAPGVTLSRSCTRDLHPQQPVRTRNQGARLPPAGMGRCALEQQDSSGPVAVECRGRTPKRFHASQRADVEVIERGLPVRQRGRDPVHQDLDAAHAELGARAEAADRDALADRGVVAVLHAHSRKSVQRLLDEEARVALGHFRAGHDGGGEGQPVQADRGSQHGHHYGLQLHGVGFGLGPETPSAPEKWKRRRSRRPRRCACGRDWWAGDPPVRYGRAIRWCCGQAICSTLAPVLGRLCLRIEHGPTAEEATGSR